MIAKTFGISCSKRCELLLAFTYVMSRKSLVPIAQRLTNDRDLSAVNIAKALQQLPEKQARQLSLSTMAQAGMSINALADAKVEL